MHMTTLNLIYSNLALQIQNIKNYNNTTHIFVQMSW